MSNRTRIRRFLRLGRRYFGVCRPIVLMYHRVAQLAVDPWSYAVTPQRFALQLDLLKSRRQIVPMAWLVQKLHSGKNPRNVAAITFDDGYADVYHRALPILQQHLCPATVFITTRALSDPYVFWWDRLSSIILESANLPEHLVVKGSGQHLEWRLQAESVQPRAGNTVGRQELHANLHSVLKHLDPEARDNTIKYLADWAQTSPEPKSRDRAMTTRELLKLSQADGIEVGIHTSSHPSLPLLDSSGITREINESLEECQRLTGQVASGLAYPYGDVNDATAQIAKSTGLGYAVTAGGREIGPWTNPWRIPRILAANWDEAEFQRKVLSHG